MKPGIYTGLSFAEYLAIPAVSQGVLQTLLDRCPSAARFDSYLNADRPRDTSDEMDCGTIAHEILLEGSTAGICVIDPNEYPADKGGAIPIGWTNKAIRAARDGARAAGLVPILKPRMGEINAMVDAAHAYIESLKNTEPAIWAAFQPQGGESELTLVWRDDEILCRARTDRISKDMKLIVDYKTTSSNVEPNRWARTQLLDYYVGAAFYRRGVRILCDTTPAYVYLVQSTEPPYLCSLIGLDPHFVDLGDRKITAALNAWRKCLADDSWPGFPARVCYPVTPAWIEAEWQDREASEPIDYASQP